MMVRLSELKCREVINICDGCRVGFVSDAELETTGGDKCFVIGGAYTYAEALQSADTLHITHVHDSPKDADAFFPKIDPQVFRVDSVAPQETDPQSGICYNFTIYKRR